MPRAGAGTSQAAAGRAASRAKKASFRGRATSTPPPLEGLGSGDDFPDRPAVVDLQALAARHLQPARVEAELVQHRRVDVGDVVPVLDRVETDVVRRPVDDPALDAAA